MTSHHTHTMPLEMYIGGKPVDISAEISFEISPEWPPGPDDPGSPAEVGITDIMLVIGGVPHWPRGYRIKCPTWLECFIYDNPEVIEELRVAGDYGRPYRDPDAAYEAWRDEGRP